MEPQHDIFDATKNSNSNLTSMVVTNDVHNIHHLVSGNSFDRATSLSDDSGIPLTNSSISSGSSRVGLCKFEFELAESDYEVSQFDSLDNCSDGGMSTENFNTLKKGPLPPTIDPPPEFQDSPQTTLLRSQVLQNFALKLAKNLITNAFTLYSTSHATKTNRNLMKSVDEEPCQLTQEINTKKNHQMYASDSLLNQYKHLDNIYDEPNVDIDYLYDENYKQKQFNVYLNDAEQSNYFNVIKSKFPKSYDVQYHSSSQKKKTPPKSVLYSPLHHHPGSNLSTSNRPNSRNSLNSRLSSSHNSLSVPTANKADDSIFITQAMSHDALIGREISDFYNVPIDSDIYALPVDVIKPDLNVNLENRISGSSKSHRNKLKHTKNNKKKRRNINNNIPVVEGSANEKTVSRLKIAKTSDKRNSVPEESTQTAEDIKRYYQRLYSSSSDSSEAAITNCAIHNKKNVVNNINNNNNSVSNHNKIEKNYSNHQQQNKSAITAKSTKTTVNLKNKKISTKDDTTTTNTNTINSSAIKYSGVKKSQFSINLKQKFCSIFRFRKSPSHSHSNINNSIEYGTHKSNGDLNSSADNESSKKVKFSTRALPPLPCKDLTEKKEETGAMDFAANIERVKECGWYWGPISSEAAEKILSNEPDGSFIVRDSSDDHYIFSLTFKLNGCIRHVRIDQDQGEFSFGSRALFKSRTITEFIENAVEHSRSGRYLFFLHRRPEHGPMRVQLTNPVSRFKHIQSLQHMCRFAILKAVVRKDLIQTLPLPRRLLDYLSYKNCYSEQVESDSSQSQQNSGDGVIS